MSGKNTIRIRPRNAESEVNCGDGTEEVEEIDGYEYLRTIESSLLSCTKLKGVPGITGVYIDEHMRKVVQEDGTVKNQKEYLLETDGSNLLLVCVSFSIRRRSDSLTISTVHE